jgi:hypothetical protein
MSEAWHTVDLFRCIENPEPQDIIELDFAMMQILADLDCEKHSTDLGYSRRFPRYQLKYVNAKKEIRTLEKHYWARERQLRKLERLIKERKKVLQSNCEHKWERDWEDRGHRSHYDCKKCGAYR